MEKRQLEAEYSPSSRVADIASHLRQYAESSARARDEWQARSTVRYGARTANQIDVFHAPGDRPPLFVYVHGGYWQELSRFDSAFCALDFLDKGISFAALGYSLAPDVTLPQIIDEVRSGINWLVARSGEIGFAADRLFIGGSSAGAQLVAMALDDSWTSSPSARSNVAGAVLLSGVYSLEPLVNTYINDAVGLTIEESRRCSPLPRLTGQLPPLVMMVGDIETDEFKRQQTAFVEHAQKFSMTTSAIVIGRNHFNLPLDLATPGTILGDAVLGLIDFNLR